MGLEEWHRLLFIVLHCALLGGLAAMVCKGRLRGVVASALILLGVISTLASAWWVQGAQPVMSFDSIIHHGSHAAIVDLALAVGFGVHVHARRRESTTTDNSVIIDEFWSSFWTSWKWFVVSCASGLALGVFFHTNGGEADSQSADMSVRMHDSATSWVHNFGVMPALATMAVYFLPQFCKLWTVPGARKYAATITTCYLIYGVGFVLDQWRLTLDSLHQWRLDVHWLDAPNGTDWVNWWERFGDLLQLVVALF